MVLWMNVEEARRFLLENGFVYTLRPKKRREGRDMLSYEGFGKKGMVMVKLVMEVENDTDLKAFVDKSGFRSVEEWRGKAKDSKILYRVDLLKVEP